ncbi:hypothetical protein [Desulfolutivibrio sulfoxidireducens]|uniref:hypothetical protein n=1 Tax=Desulfolutivibrio sulfoxidireducens TaxID=2773299 RepID=UPI00159E548B|nr:hypothetical protein [Desulfolutivibrio sulfoxidireducens]QLA18818.1 hypothetical protein GD604_03280 [Desulfolutivibrio sulfoxidireducens]
MSKASIPVLAVLVIFLSVGGALAQTAPEQPGAQGVQAAEQVYIHFFAVPRVLPGGKEAAEKYPALRAFLARTAGGYSQLGTCDGGALLASGEVRTATNTCFLVSASHDISDEIATYLKANFGEKTPYVVAWPGSRR